MQRCLDTARVRDLDSELDFRLHFEGVEKTEYFLISRFS